MVELRWYVTANFVKKLQYRYLPVGVDASGAFCPNGNWSEWIDVSTVEEE